jgi:hypothetical protein
MLLISAEISLLTLRTAVLSDISSEETTSSRLLKICPVPEKTEKIFN